MKKNLYKIFASLTLLFIAAISQAQVNVTYVVDISDSIASPTFTLAGGGMRVGGNFHTTAGILPSTTDTLAEWTPSNSFCSMTNLSGNLWAITVQYSNAAIGTTQQWKFVNGDWGGDEGQNNTTDIDSTCGIGNGLGGFNRSIVIPAVNSIYAGNFNQCGILAPTGIHEIQSGVASLDLYPNPALNFTQVTYGLTVNDNVTLTLRSFTGQVLRTLVNKVQSPGLYTYDLGTDDLAAGMYFVQINVKGVTFDKRFVVNR